MFLRLHSRGTKRQKQGKPTLHRGETFANRADYKHGNLRYKHADGFTTAADPKLAVELYNSEAQWRLQLMLYSMCGAGRAEQSIGEVCHLLGCITHILMHLMISSVMRWCNNCFIKHMATSFCSGFWQGKSFSTTFKDKVINRQSKCGLTVNSISILSSVLHR